MTSIEGLGQSLRVAWRALGRARAFTGAAVATLSIGIAGTTLMFALIQGVLLRPLPVRQQDRLLLAWKEVRTSGSAQYPFGRDDITAVGRASRLLESAAGVDRNGVGREIVVDRGMATYANVGLVTGGFFDVLGVHPVVGRTLTPDDDRERAAPVVVISRGFWQRRYGASREVVGHPVVIDDLPFTIAGVMPADLDYPAGVEIWRLTSSMPAAGPFGDAARQEVNLIARMRPGVTLTQASQEIGALSSELDAGRRAGAGPDLVPVVRPFEDVMVGDARRPLLALFAAVALVLLIASANVANLLLMRGEARRAELAVRVALGAGRLRIVGESLTESAIVALLAGAAGISMAWWGVRGIVAIQPDDLPRLDAIRIDGAVALFCIGVVFLTTMAAGLVPSLAALRADLLSPLRENGGGTRVATGHGRRALVVVQVALAMTVLAAAGIFIRSVLALQAVDLGMPAAHLVLLDLHLPPEKFADRRWHAQYLDAAISGLEALPIISAATPVNVLPFQDRGWDVPAITAEGQTSDQAAANPSLNLESIHPNYFETLQVPILRGRAFTPADREDTPAVAILSDDVAARLWPGENPVGKRLKVGDAASVDPWRTVVGVAASTRYRTLTTARPTLYLPAAQFQMTAENVIVRTSAPLELLTSLAADRIHLVDPRVRVMRVLPFSQMLSRPLARPRFTALLLGLFGATALLLSGVGLYAVMAAQVRRRDREIAIRVAVGATASGVRRLVLAEVVRLAGLGACLGLAGAVAGTRLVRGMLFEVGPLDPWALSGAALLLVVASALATYAPLRRATRLDPAALLRR